MCYDDIEYMGFLPLNCDQYDWYDNDDEGVMIMDYDIMQNDYCAIELFFAILELLKTKTQMSMYH